MRGKKVTELGYGISVIGLIIGWLAIVISGYILSSDAAEKDINANFNLINAIKFILSFTWTNVCLACCLSSTMGELLRSTFSSTKRSPRILSAILRGFCVYLAIIVGQVVIAGDFKLPIESAVTTPGSVPALQGFYFRVVAATSFGSFIMGFKPVAFLNLMNKIATRMGVPNDEDEAASE